MKRNFTVGQGALDGVEAFPSVAHHRGFRRAAAERGGTPSAIGEAVRTLEARIGAALFTRTTRGVGLTEAGEQFRTRAKPAFEELLAASEVARDPISVRVDVDSLPSNSSWSGLTGPSCVHKRITSER